MSQRLCFRNLAVLTSRTTLPINEWIPSYPWMSRLMCHRGSEAETSLPINDVLPMNIIYEWVNFILSKLMCLRTMFWSLPINDILPVNIWMSEFHPTYEWVSHCASEAVLQKACSDLQDHPTYQWHPTWMSEFLWSMSRLMCHRELEAVIENLVVISMATIITCSSQSIRGGS